MSEARRQAYLEAMDYDVWVLRPPEPERDRLVVGPGQGSTLLVCASPEDCASRLSGDIGRVLGGDPVWAWPDPQGSPQNPCLEDTVRDSLFTRVVVFGDDTARLLFGKDVPAVIVSSAVTVAPGIADLAVRGTAKQAFWAAIRPGATVAGDTAGP